MAASNAMSAPECDRPTTRTEPVLSWDGLWYSCEWSCRIDGSSSVGERRDVWLPERPGRDDDLARSEAPAVRRSKRRSRRRAGSIAVDACPTSDRQVELSGVGLEVVGHLATCRPVRRGRGEAHARERVVAGRAVQPERVPAIPPVVADPRVGVEDRERQPALREVIPGRQAGLSGADDDRVDPLRVPCVHRRPPCRSVVRVRRRPDRPVAIQHPIDERRWARIGGTTQTARARPMGTSRQTRPCSYANAVAAARVDTSSFVKMLLTCRSTVRSLIVRCLGDRPVGQAGSHEPEDLDLARAQAAGDAAAAASAPSPRPRRPGPGPASPRVARTPRGPRPPRASPHRRRRARDRRIAVSDPDPRGIVRRIERRPGLPRPTQDAERALDVARPPGERHPPRARAIARRSGASTASAIAAESIGRLARRHEVVRPPARSRRPARATASPDEVVDRLGQGAPDRRLAAAPTSPCASRSSAWPGLGESPPRSGLAIADLRRSRTPRAADRARRAGRSLRRRPARAGVATATSRARSASMPASSPGAVDAHQLGAVDEAVAAERDEFWLRIEPARQRGRPLLRATQVVQLMAGLDDRAVDDARHDRRDLAGDHRGHRLVEQRDRPAGPRPSRSVTARVRADRSAARSRSPNRSAMAATCSNVANAVPGSPDISDRSAVRDEQPPSLGAVVAGLIDEPRRAREPAAGLGHLAALHERHPERDGDRGSRARHPRRGWPRGGRAHRPRRTPRRGRSGTPRSPVARGPRRRERPPRRRRSSGRRPRAQA